MPDSVDVLAFAAHPDDVELFAGGIVAKLVGQGYRVGIVDLTRGELGSRGTPALRKKEASEAGRILGIHARENLGMADGDIANTAESRWRIIRTLRKYRPHIVLANAPDCRHPDHPAASRLVTEAAYYSGLSKITSQEDGVEQAPWRPAHLLHYMQSIPFEPTFVVDVSDVWEQRMEALMAYSSQFHSADYEADEPQTFISDPAFLEWIEARARTLGYRIGAKFGEALLYHHGPVGVDNLMQTLSASPPR